jgi:hypothetical protein
MTRTSIFEMMLEAEVLSDIVNADQEVRERKHLFDCIFQEGDQLDTGPQGSAHRQSGNEHYSELRLYA